METLTAWNLRQATARKRLPNPLPLRTLRSRRGRRGRPSPVFPSASAAVVVRRGLGGIRRRIELVLVLTAVPLVGFLHRLRAAVGSPVLIDLRIGLIRGGLIERGFLLAPVPLVTLLGDLHTSARPILLLFGPRPRALLSHR